MNRFNSTLSSICRFIFLTATFAVLGLFGSSTKAQLIYADSFSYPDGKIDFAPGSPWVLNYEPSNQFYVQSGKLVLSATNQESIRYDFTNYYSSGSLYARMVVNVSKLPAGNGNYFAFFRQASVDNLRGRIWVYTNAAVAPGKFRFGIASTGASILGGIPQDFYPGTNYTLVLRYDVTNSYTTLWVNPRDENDTNFMAQQTSDFGNLPIQHFGFAQTRPGQSVDTDNIGTLTVDDLRIGRSFTEVLPQVRFTSISNLAGGSVVLKASGQATTNYVFQVATNLAAGGWVNVSTNAADTNGLFNVSDPGVGGVGQRFYRLLRQ